MAAYILLLIVTLVLPVVVGVFAAVRLRQSKAVFLGAVCFFLMQGCIRIPLLQYVLPMFAQYTAFQIAYPILYLFLLALSAGVFEECGRYLFLKILKARTLTEGISFGIGHGGIEAVLLVGINAAALAFYPQLLYGTASGDYFLSAVERLAAMTAHIGFSVLVLSSQAKRRSWLLAVAVCLHTALDFLALYLTRKAGWSAWLTEAFVAVFAVITIVLALIIWKNVSEKGEISCNEPE